MNFWQLHKYADKQIDEIKSDSLLSNYSHFLIGIHLLTALFWFYQGFESILTNVNQSYCWPFFSSCESAKILLLPIVPLLLPTYAILSIFGLLQSTIFKKSTWFLLIGLEVMKLLFQSLDYRFMGNYHFMPHIITLVFLFSSNKKFWINIWMLSFYVGAASLKLNYEWLTGASLSWKIPFNKIELMQWQAITVILIELSAPLLLSFKNFRFRVGGLAFLFVFHIASYYWVGFFYPAVMLSLLAFFFIDLFSPRTETKIQFRSLSFLLGSISWLIFIFMQISSLNNSRAKALGSQSRLWSLNMFDARSMCRGVFFAHEDSQTTELDFQNEELASRVKCDPIIFYEQARHICQNKSARVRSLEAHLVSRQFSDIDNLVIVREKDICKIWPK